MATYYSDVALPQSDSLSDASKQVTLKDEILASVSVITLTAPSIATDVHYLQYIPAGAIFSWANASILSTNAALAGTVGLVDVVTGVYTAYGTLTAASNIGRLTAPTNISFAATTSDKWLAYQLGTSPPTSGTAQITVPRKALAS